jgi:hypothetical protein
LKEEEMQGQRLDEEKASLNLSFIWTEEPDHY